MSTSLLFDALRKHNLDQFYPTFSAYGITQLEDLAELSVQEYASLGITDISDRRKIFGLIQVLRKEKAPRLVTSASTITSGIRPPQTYTPTSTQSFFTSRLPQPPDSARMRRSSVFHDNTNKPASSPAPPIMRPIRSRTMSDAGHHRVSSARNSDLRRSLLTAQYQQTDDDEEEDEENTRRYRSSAPLVNVYGLPTSKLKPRASMGALKAAAAATTTTTTIARETAPSDLNQKIRVCVRKRPLSKKELERGERDIANVLSMRTIQINEPKLKLDLTKYIEQHTFTFDDVFGSDASNTTIYERTALPLVEYIFRGGKATCFAYGQTGSGKTFTMLDPRHGLYVLAARDIFANLRKPENQHLSAWVGLYEIYQGQLYDLLNNRKKLFAREDGKQNVIISGLKEYAIENVDNLLQVFAYGNQIRSTGTTGANDTSSRSHAVLQILLKPRKNRKLIHGKLSFIDLAGSERGADRGESDTKTRMEGAEINKSLLALKECIRALDQEKGHTPFRQSKLTQVLKDSFVGNSRTCMIATISPGGSNCEHTLNTLRYADRVKELKGERDRRAQLEKRQSSPAWMSPPATHSPNDNEEEEDGYDSNDSDILDEDTFDIGAEDDIFNVDFPHEHDAFIHSSSYTLRRSSSPLGYEDNKPVPQRRSQPQSSSSSITNDNSNESDNHHNLLLFDCSQMEDLIKLHRAQLREVTDCSKRETKLVGRVSSELPLCRDKDQLFRDYLRELDELLEEKAAAVEALRDRINETVSQIPM